jgi:hypothetical protein
MKNNIAKIIIYWIILILSILIPSVGYLLFGSASYFSDRLIILYKDEENNNHSVMVELTRYNIFPFYNQFKYNISLADSQREVFTKKYEFSSFDNFFKSADFIKKINNTNNENILSEGYVVGIDVDGKKIDIDLGEMTNDFLINNSLERLTYINMGPTVIVVDGVAHSADYVLNKTASIKYLKSTSYPKSTGLALFFSDTLGELYYVDITKVLNSKSKYVSHSWALNKNNQILKKDVGEQVKLISNNEKNIILDLPNFNNARVKLNKISEFSLVVDNNLLSGEIVDSEGERIITGYSISYGRKK